MCTDFVIHRFVTLLQPSVTLSAIDTDHVCLCGSCTIDGKLKGIKDNTNGTLFTVRKLKTTNT